MMWVKFIIRPLLIIKDKGIPSFPNRSRDKTTN